MIDFDDIVSWQDELKEITNDGRLNAWIARSRENGWTFLEKMPVRMAVEFWDLMIADPNIVPKLPLANEYWIKGDDGFDVGRDAGKLVEAREGIDLVLYFMRWFGWMRDFPPASSTHAIRIVSAGVALGLQPVTSFDSDRFFMALLRGNGKNWFTQGD